MKPCLIGERIFMDSNDALPTQIIEVTIDRGESEDENTPVTLAFSDFDNLKLFLSDSSVDDIKNLFDTTFEYISTHKQMVEFTLNDAENDLFNQISNDILEQLNAEIKEAEDNFSKIWNLVESSDEDEEAVVTEV